MEYRNLGKSGLKVSRICLGMMTYGDPTWRDWVLDEETARPLVRRAVELGINFFDTANMYSYGRSEELTGKLLMECAKRDEVVIATKVYFPLNKDANDSYSNLNGRGLSRKHIISACKASLKRLRTDYIDLYQIHRWDNETPIEETMEALHDLVKSGKVRYLGASSMYAWQFAKAQYTAKINNLTKFISMQNHYNLVFREEEREMIPQCLDMNVGIMVWSPLARGFLTKPSSLASKTKRAKSDTHAHKMYYAPNDFEVLKRVEKLAARQGRSMAQIALAWVLQQPGVTSPIIGARNIHHLEEAINTLDKVTLTEDDIRFLDELYQPHPVVTNM
ncbi:MAG: hypothetical protein RLZ12_764 [Bacillota bacterium]|jgi:aryl-alcohol dehydrogenase (NADP+)